MNYKIVRIITAHQVVPWHLSNYLNRVPSDFQVYVIGDSVSRYKKDFPNTEFFDVQIKRGISFFYDIIALFKIILLLYHIKPHIVHSIMPKSGLLSAIAAFFTRVPIRIHTFTGQVWYDYRGFVRKIFIFFDKIILFLNTDCYADSISQAALLKKSGVKNKYKSIKVLGYGSLAGVDVDKILRIQKNEEVINELKKKYYIEEDDFIFIFLARKNRNKGIFELLEAFKKISYKNDVKLLFIGPDESNGELKDYLLENNISNVIHIDAVINHFYYLMLGHVLCLPSYREGFGSIVIDAACLGIPTIGTDVVGLVDSIVNNETGILIPKGNIEKLYDAMIFLYENRYALKMMGESAKKRAFNYFNADYVCNLQTEVYRKNSILL